MRPRPRYPWPVRGSQCSQCSQRPVGGSRWQSVGGTLVLEKAWYRMQSGSVVMGVAVCTRPRKPTTAEMLARLAATLFPRWLRPSGQRTPRPQAAKRQSLTGTWYSGTGHITDHGLQLAYFICAQIVLVHRLACDGVQQGEMHPGTHSLRHRRPPTSVPTTVHNLTPHVHHHQPVLNAYNMIPAQRIATTGLVRFGTSLGSFTRSDLENTLRVKTLISPDEAPAERLLTLRCSPKGGIYLGNSHS